MRSAFFAVGLFVFLCGGLFLLTQQIEVRHDHDISLLTGWWTQWTAEKGVFHPPEWAGFSLCSAGLLTMLYTIALPSRRTPTPAMVVSDHWPSTIPHAWPPVSMNNT